MTVRPAESSGRPARSAQKRLTLAWYSVWSLGAYLGIVSGLDRVLPVVNRRDVALLALLLSAIVGHRAVVWFCRRVPGAASRVKQLGLLTATVLVSLLCVDIGFTVYANLRGGLSFDPTRIFTGRDNDPIVWDGELMPHPYAPTPANFLAYKPGQTRSGEVYGEFYYPALLEHPVLRDSVLELHKIDFVIDRYGFRNTQDPSTSNVFVVGDSFAFGYHVTQAATVPVLLSARLGEPAYNMGISGTSPFQQYLMLEHFLRGFPELFHPKRVLWLIFEGNDLEEDYEPLRPVAAPPPSVSGAFAGTVIGTLTDIPAQLRRQSLIRRLSTGAATIAGAGRHAPGGIHYQLDGQTLAYPLYHSPRLGYSLFRQAYLDRATQPESYVLNHYNRPKLAETFRRMKALSQERHFDVTVVAVPSSARLYKDDFEDFPPITAIPYFLRYVMTLAGDAGFSQVDLSELLGPSAKREMLYQRDDTHWNERGHQVVAELLADHILGDRH